VVVFRKYGADATTKIEELMAQSPETLIQANVLWGEFIQGHYFQGEGKRFVLGEFQAKDPTKYRDVDRVISDQSVPNIAKLLRKFPGSRVDWKLLDATETEPIAYNNGDSIVLAGQTLEMRDGVWVPVGAGQTHPAWKPWQAPWQRPGRRQQRNHLGEGTGLRQDAAGHGPHAGHAYLAGQGAASGRQAGGRRARRALERLLRRSGHYRRSQRSCTNCQIQVSG
jgi:hypothetical protein